MPAKRGTYITTFQDDFVRPNAPLDITSDAIWDTQAALTPVQYISKGDPGVIATNLLLNPSADSGTTQFWTPRSTMNDPESFLSVREGGEVLRETNLVKNPKAAVDLSNVSLNGGGFVSTSLTREPCSWHPGASFCFRIAGTNPTAVQRALALRFATAGGIDALPVVAGQTIQCSAYVKTLDPVTPWGYRWRADFYNAAGANVGAANGAMSSDEGAIDLRVSGKFTTPAGAAFGLFGLQMISEDGSDVGSCEITCALIHAGDELSDYFDGDIAPVGYTSRWTGAPNASASTLIALAPVPPFGTHSFAMTRDSDGSGPTSIYMAQTVDMPVSPGEVFSFGASFYPDRISPTINSRNCSVTLIVNDADGNLVTQASTGSIVCPVNTWTRVFAENFVMPAGAAKISSVRLNVSVASEGETIFTDGAMLVRGTTLPPYFDGYYCFGGYDSRWLGKPYESASELMLSAALRHPASTSSNRRAAVRSTAHPRLTHVRQSARFRVGSDLALGGLIGFFFRAPGGLNLIRAYYSTAVGGLRIADLINNNGNTLATGPTFSLKTNTQYWLRAQVKGGDISLSIWDRDPRHGPLTYTNLVPGNDGSSDAAWTNYYGGDWSIASEEPIVPSPDGGPAIRVMRFKSSSGQNSGRILQQIPFNAGDPCSAYCRFMALVNPGRARLVLTFQDALGNNLSTQVGRYVTSQGIGDWVDLTREGTIAPAGTTKVQYRIDIETGSVGDIFYFDSFNAIVAGAMPDPNFFGDRLPNVVSSWWPTTASIYPLPFNRVTYNLLESHSFYNVAGEYGIETGNAGPQAGDWFVDDYVVEEPQEFVTFVGHVNERDNHTAVLLGNGDAEVDVTDNESMIWSDAARANALGFDVRAGQQAVIRPVPFQHRTRRTVNG